MKRVFKSLGIPTLTTFVAVASIAATSAPQIQFSPSGNKAAAVDSVEPGNPNVIDLGVPGGSAMDLLKNTRNPVEADASNPTGAQTMRTFCVAEDGSAYEQGEDGYSGCIRSKNRAPVKSK